MNFLQFFQFLTVETVYQASGNIFYIKCYSFRLVEVDFLSSILSFRANSVLVESILYITVKPFVIEYVSPSIGNHFLGVFTITGK